MKKIMMKIIGKQILEDQQQDQMEFVTEGDCTKKPTPFT